MKPDDTSVSIFKVEQPEIWHDPETQGPGVWADCWSDKANSSVKFQVLQPHTPSGDDDEESDVQDAFVTYMDAKYDVLWEKTADNISIDGSNRTIIRPDSGVMSSAEAYAWVQTYTPEKDVFFAFVAEYAGASGGGGETSTLVPIDVNKSGGVTGDETDIDSCTTGDQSDADGSGMVIPAGGFKTITADMTDGPDSTSQNGHKVYVRARGSSGGEGFAIRLYEGTTQIEGKSYSTASTGAWGWHVLNVGGTKAKDISDYADLKVYIGAGNAGGSVEIDEIYMQYPGDSAQVNIGDAYIWSQAGYHCEISLVSLDSKNPKNNNLGDRNDIYISTNSKIYEVSNSELLDVSRSGDAYGLSSLDDVSKLWSYCAFGDDVIATNYSDEPQRRVFGDAAFTDLYDAGAGTQEPYGRFCAVIGAQLVFADINPTSYASGKPFHLWCSKPMEPDNFELTDVNNLTALFALVAKPGAITGLVGGEYGTVFKRNSIWRQTFVGLPTIYQFDMVAEGVGCSHPQSIVQAGQDTYFWDSSGIFALRNNAQVERISGGKIEKALFDSKFESNALYTVYGGDSRENEALVWGSYDAYSGLVWWLYRTADESQYAMNNIIVYSTKENRFTTVDKSGMDLALVLGRKNVWSNEPVLNRGVIGIQSDGTDINMAKFINDSTYYSALKTKTLSTASWGYQPGRDAELLCVRPVYKSEQEVVGSVPGDDRPNFQITCTAAQDAGFNNGFQQEKVDMSRQNLDGWVPIDPMQGEFYQFRIQTPSLYRTNVKEILGLQLKTRQAGDN